MDDHDFNLDELMDELTDRAEEACRDAAEDVINELLEERVNDAVYEALQDALPEAVSECLAGYEFVLKDGTLVRPRQRTKVLSPDGSKLLICYGGLRVDGRSLIIQTRLSCWEWIADYPDREAAIAALKKVKAAMEAELPLVELADLSE